MVEFQAPYYSYLHSIPFAPTLHAIPTYTPCHSPHIPYHSYIPYYSHLHSIPFLLSIPLLFLGCQFSIYSEKKSRHFFSPKNVAQCHTMSRNITQCHRVFSFLNNKFLTHRLRKSEKGHAITIAITISITITISIPLIKIRTIYTKKKWNSKFSVLNFTIITNKSSFI